MMRPNTVASAHRLENLNAIAPWQHPIQHNQVERLGIQSEESFLARFSHGSVITLRLQSVTDGLCGFHIIFDDQDFHSLASITLFYTSAKRAILKKG